MKAPELFETVRLLLQRPRATDLEAIFTRYASDPDVTRFVAWPRHRSLADTEAFLASSDAEWDRWPAGPYILRSRVNGAVLGGTGFAFETPYRASTGYLLAKDAWGKGYATEALQAIVEIARMLGIRRLYAFCHTEHRASRRVLRRDSCGKEFCTGIPNSRT